MKNGLKAWLEHQGWFVRRTSGLQYGASLGRDLNLPCCGAGGRVQTIWDVGAAPAIQFESLLGFGPVAASSASSLRPDVTPS
jgi:hypothetical protein